jgi:hypothetical protein
VPRGAPAGPPAPRRRWGDSNAWKANWTNNTRVLVSSAADATAELDELKAAGIKPLDVMALVETYEMGVKM